MKRSTMIQIIENTIGELGCECLPDCSTLLESLESAGMLPPVRVVENNRIFSGMTAPAQDNKVAIFEWEPEDE